MHEARHQFWFGWRELESWPCGTCLRKTGSFPRPGGSDAAKEALKEKRHGKSGVFGLLAPDPLQDGARAMAPWSWIVAVTACGFRDTLKARNQEAPDFRLDPKRSPAQGSGERGARLGWGDERTKETSSSIQRGKRKSSSSQWKRSSGTFRKRRASGRPHEGREPLLNRSRQQWTVPVWSGEVVIWQRARP